MDAATATAANDDDPQSPSPTRTPPPPPTSSAVTVAASPHPNPHPQTLTLALPIQTPSPSNGAGGGGRDDCWSDDATSALIDAWGERYLDLGRGSLKQKHWQEVADAVSARDDYTKPPKSDVQCKNRVDTLKKKYKSEKSKIGGRQSQRSTWPFFHRLDILVGPTLLKQQPQPPPPKLAAASAAPFPPQFPQRSRTQTVVNSTVRKRPRSISPPPQPPATATEEEDGIRELTRAIVKFGEVYERVERAKAEQMAEAAKQRMGFEREIELQRMQFFVNAQLELSHLDSRLNSKRRSGSGYDRRRHRRSSGNGGGSNNSES